MKVKLKSGDSFIEVDTEVSDDMEETPSEKEKSRIITIEIRMNAC